MVKVYGYDLSGNTLPPLHGLLFSISSKWSFICTIHREGSTYLGLCYTSRGALAGTRKRSMGPPWRIDPTTYRTTYVCVCVCVCVCVFTDFLIGEYLIWRVFRTGLTSVPRCEPSTYQPVTRRVSHCDVLAGVVSVKSL